MATIWYLFAVPPSSGGDFVNLEHVAALNRMGFDARALYTAPDDGIRHFSVPVERSGVAIGPGDVLVMGEIQREMFATARRMPNPKVLHNQNPYFTFFGFDDVAALNAYPLAHVLVPSDFCAARLRALGMAHPVSRVHPALPEIFRPASKKLQVAYSPVKRRAEAPFLRELFKARAPQFASVPWLALENVARAEVARVMGESAVFASFALLESLGLLALEAMACGCHVVGYDGHGGTEYATPQNGDWVADGDMDAFVEKLADACRLFESGADNPRIAAGRAAAAGFSQGPFEAQLRAAWDTILGAKAALYRK